MIRKTCYDYFLFKEEEKMIMACSSESPRFVPTSAPLEKLKISVSRVFLVVDWLNEIFESTFLPPPPLVP